jgi:hypothetical protein
MSINLNMVSVFQKGEAAALKSQEDILVQELRAHPNNELAGSLLLKFWREKKQIFFFRAAHDPRFTN